MHNNSIVKNKNPRTKVNRKPNLRCTFISWFLSHILHVRMPLSRLEIPYFVHFVWTGLNVQCT